jgi:hypothetical protein
LRGESRETEARKIKRRHYPQYRRFGVYLERDKKTEAVKYEIRGAFNQTFQGEVTSDGVDLQDFKDVATEHLEELKVAVKTGKSKTSKSSSGGLGRPYHAKQNIHGKDRCNDPQVEQ